MSADATTTGVIHDLGYRHYDGPRLGRRHALRALYLNSLRGSYGIGRGGKAKILPFAMLAIMCAPAIVVTVVASQTGKVEIRYDAYARLLELPITLFLAAQAPEMLSRDLRFKVLPLYFSRPIRRDDYALAKLGAMVTALLALMAIPLLILYLGADFSVAKGAGGVWDQTKALAPALVNVVFHAVLLAALGLAVASFSSKRAYATGAIAVLYFVSRVLSGLGQSAGGDSLQHAAGLITPFDLLEGVKQWALHGKPIAVDIGDAGPIYGLVAVGLTALALSVLIVRYRKVAA
jgi:ABC-2 type transport system permease protein